MSVKVYTGNWYGVDAFVMTQGDGTIRPRLLSVASLSSGVVRVTYDRAMDSVRTALGNPVPTILHPNAYRVYEAAGGKVLGVVSVEKVSDTEYDLYTSYQRNAVYNVEIHGVYDLFGLEIDPLYTTASFTGTEKTYTIDAPSFYGFFGMYGGMQETGQADVAPDVEAPVLQNLGPDNGDIDVLRSTTVELEIIDEGSGVNAGSVIIKINGVFAWHTDAPQVGFSGTKAIVSNGYSYVLTPDALFDSYDDVVVEVYARDQAPIPNALDTSYSFRIIDVEAPYLANRDPAPDDTGVSPLAQVILDVLDAGDPLNAGTVVITVDGDIVWQSGSEQNGYTVLSQALISGYRYTITPPLPLPQLQVIPVSVQAYDTAPVPNYLDKTYYFTTATDIPPEVRNQEPASGEGNVAADQAIEFDAWDNVEINESSTLIVVNNVLAYQLSTPQNGFTVNVTTIAEGYHYEVISPDEWPFGGIITTQVFLRDTLGVSSSYEWLFYIYEDPNCFTGPINAFEASLLLPYDLAGTALYHTEILRNKLLLSVSTRPDPLKSVRQVYLRAFRSDLGPMLRDIVQAPSSRESNVKLCYKRTLVQIDVDLRSKPGMIAGALSELRGLGLPTPHYQMLRRYLSTDEPNDLVPLACVIVVLAKALEENALS